MQLVQILLPLSDNDGKPFPPEMFEILKQELTRDYRGVTAFVQAPAQGRWSEDEADVSEENIVIFEVMVDDLNLGQWRRRRKDLERRFRQERVVIRHMTIGLI